MKIESRSSEQIIEGRKTSRVAIHERVSAFELHRNHTYRSRYRIAEDIMSSSFGDIPGPQLILYLPFPYPKQQRASSSPLTTPHADLHA